LSEKTFSLCIATYKLYFLDKCTHDVVAIAFRNDSLEVLNSKIVTNLQNIYSRIFCSSSYL